MEALRERTIVPGKYRRGSSSCKSGRSVFFLTPLSGKKRVKRALDTPEPAGGFP
jgi:hypothetical protein